MPYCVNIICRSTDGEGLSGCLLCESPMMGIRERWWPIRTEHEHTQTHCILWSSSESTLDLGWIMDQRCFLIKKNKPMNIYIYANRFFIYLLTYELIYMWIKIGPWDDHFLRFQEMTITSPLPPWCLPQQWLLRWIALAQVLHRQQVPLERVDRYNVHMNRTQIKMSIFASLDLCLYIKRYRYRNIEIWK